MADLTERLVTQDQRDDYENSSPEVRALGERLFPLADAVCTLAINSRDRFTDGDRTIAGSRWEEIGRDDESGATVMGQLRYPTLSSPLEPRELIGQHTDSAALVTRLDRGSVPGRVEQEVARFGRTPAFGRTSTGLGQIGLMDDGAIVPIGLENEERLFPDASELVAKLQAAFEPVQ